MTRRDATHTGVDAVVMVSFYDLMGGHVSLLRGVTGWPSA